MSGFQKKYDVYIQNSKAKMYNDYLLIQEPEQLRFYQVRQIEKYLSIQQTPQEEVMIFRMLASS